MQTKQNISIYITSSITSNWGKKKLNAIKQKLVFQQMVRTTLHILLLITQFNVIIWLVFNILLQVTIFMPSWLGHIQHRGLPMQHSIVSHTLYSCIRHRIVFLVHLKICIRHFKNVLCEGKYSNQPKKLEISANRELYLFFPHLRLKTIPGSGNSKAALSSLY